MVLEFRRPEAGSIDASAPTLCICGLSRHVTGFETDTFQEALEDGIVCNRFGASRAANFDKMNES